jgi:hypothetical protein
MVSVFVTNVTPSLAPPASLLKGLAAAGLRGGVRSAASHSRHVGWSAAAPPNPPTRQARALVARFLNTRAPSTRATRPRVRGMASRQRGMHARIARALHREGGMRHAPGLADGAHPPLPRGPDGPCARSDGCDLRRHGAGCSECPPVSRRSHLLRGLWRRGLLRGDLPGAGLPGDGRRHRGRSCNPKPCGSDADCPPAGIQDYACFSGACGLKGCAKDADCHGGFCVNHVCAPQPGLCAPGAA